MNSENKENVSNYQLLKRKPSVWSTSLHFSKLITVAQFFRVTPVLQWFQLNIAAGNFRGRRPSTSALHTLLRLTAVKKRDHNPFCYPQFPREYVAPDHCQCCVNHSAELFTPTLKETISFPEPTCLLVSTKTRSSGIINKLVPRAFVAFAFKI